jgi:pimeloyl-ACP methyl ester carboxylesterase
MPIDGHKRAVPCGGPEDDGSAEHNRISVLPRRQVQRQATGRQGVGVTKFLSRGGASLAYDIAGAGDSAMIFVHGWSCDRSYFAPQFEHFAAGHAVAAMDLRGHGDSSQPGPGSYDVETLADDALAVAEAVGFTDPVVVGHSLGALIGLACAARPDAIRALVMIDPAPITNEAAKAFFRESFDAINADDDRSWRTAFVSGMFLPTDMARRAAIIQDMPAVSPGIAAALIRAMGEFDGASALGKVAVPVLSIGSAVPTNEPADLRSACPAITIGQTVGAGHFNQLEVPEQVNAMIEQFMAINHL